MRGDGRDWLDAQPLPDAAREQLTVALAMIDALERADRPAGPGAALVCAPRRRAARR